MLNIIAKRAAEYTMNIIFSNREKDLKINNIYKQHGYIFLLFITAYYCFKAERKEDMFKYYLGQLEAYWHVIKEDVEVIYGKRLGRCDFYEILIDCISD